jgi:hypothetical protein
MSPTYDQVVTATQQTGNPPPGDRYDTRLATRIPARINQRLRLLTVLRGDRLQHVLSELLDRELPTAEQLAEQIEGAKTGD